jgi:hypothetical protein
VRDGSGRVVAAGRFERDLEWERDTGRAGWIEQGAFVVPEHQGRGLHPRALRAVCDVTRRPLLADTQQTTACARVWAHLVADPAREPLMPPDPGVTPPVPQSDEARLYLAASAALVEGQSPWLVGFLDDKLLLV